MVQLTDEKLLFFFSANVIGDIAALDKNSRYRTGAVRDWLIDEVKIALFSYVITLSS